MGIIDPIKILVFGTPGTCVFECSQRLSEFHSLDLVTIEQEPCVDGDYFADKIPSMGIDVGDFTDGSSSQHMARNPYSWAYSRELNSVRVPSVDDPLSEVELAEIKEIPQGIIATEVADEGLLEWATHVIFLDADTKEAIKWFSLRRKCPACGSVYHLDDKPPIQMGLCDRCGTQLIRKPEDDPVLIRQQYKYWEHRFWRMKLIAKKSRKFLYIKVDEAESFDEIIKRIDKWVKKTTGIQSASWYYKPSIDDVPTLPANDLISNINNELPNGVDSPMEVSINIAKSNPFIKEAVDDRYLETHPGLEHELYKGVYNKEAVQSLNGFDVGQPVALFESVYIIQTIYIDPVDNSRYIYVIQKEDMSDTKYINSINFRTILDEGNTVIKTLPEYYAYQERLKVKPKTNIRPQWMYTAPKPVEEATKHFVPKNKSHMPKMPGAW